MLDSILYQAAAFVLFSRCWTLLRVWLWRREMGQYHSYHSDHSWQSSLASGATASACRLQDSSSPARHFVPHDDDQSGFDSPYTRRHLRLAGKGDLVVPWTRTAGFGPRRLSVAGPSAWNSLPPEIKTASLTPGQTAGW